MGRAGTYALMLVAFSLLATPSAQAGQGRPPSSSASREPPSGTVRIRDETAVEDDGELVSRVFVRLPLAVVGERRLEELRSTPQRFSLPYRRALTRVMAAGDLLSPEQAREMAESMRAMPEVRISDEIATVAAKTRGWPLWETVDDGRLLRSRAIEIPPRGRLVVVLRSPDGNPLAVDPLPDSDDGEGNLAWEFVPGESADIDVHLRQSVGRDDPFSRSAVSFLTGAIPFALLLLLFAWPGGADLLPRRQLLRFAIAGVLVSLCCAGHYVYEDLAAPIRESDFVSASIGGLGAVIFVSLSLRRRALGTVVMLALLAALSAVIADQASLDISFIRHGDLGTLPTLKHTERTALELGIGCLLSATLLAAIIAAAGRWLATLVPTGLLGTLGRIRARYWLLAAGLASLAITAELVLATRSQTFWDTFHNGEPGPSAALGYFIEFVPIVFSNMARNLTIPLLSIALWSWLWTRADAGEVPFSSRRECAVLGLLFASAVTGLGGQIDGYAVPLGFLIAMALVTFAVQKLVGSQLASERRREVVRREAPDLLRRSALLALIRQQRHALRDKIVAERADSGELTSLDQRWDEQLASPALAAFDPEKRAGQALALGLTGASGARARWRALGSLRWVILAGPVAYSVFSLIDRNVGDAASAAEPVGLAFLTLGVVNQAFVWVAAAWCFIVLMPFIPGRIGPFKGILAGIFSAIPPGLASTIVDDIPEPQQWLFVSTELTLLFITVGLVLDYRSVRAIGGDLRQLGELYSITSIRAAVVYLAPLALLIFSVVHGLATGSGASALEGLFTNAGSLLPGSR